MAMGCHARSCVRVIAINKFCWEAARFRLPLRDFEYSSVESNNHILRRLYYRT